jgi:sugar lactone lactonase YvrE
VTARLDAHVALRADDVLGEGPCWDAQAQRLLRVDIGGGLVHSWWPASGRSEVITVGGRVSLAVPARDGDLLLAVEDRILLTRGAAATQMCAIEADVPGTQLNDGKCDTSGRLWVGTYSKSGLPEAGLYCVDESGEVRRVLSRLIASNGLAWTPDGAFLYVTDTGRRSITRFRIDPAVPALYGAERFCEFPPGDGVPDGIATDVDGGVWVAVFGGGAIRRYSPAGTVDAECRLPITYPTSVAFGGDGRDVIFVTTARHRLSRDALGREPLAGSVFAVDARRKGTETHRFGPVGELPRQPPP